MERDRDRDAEEDSASPSKADLMRAKLKVVARYAMLAFAPAVSVAALVVAVIAVTNNQSQSDRAKLGELTARINGLNATLSDTRSELDGLKFAMVRDKAMRADERKKADELDGKIVQSVTRLQVKLKVSPTLETQLREAASAPAVASSVAASAPVAVPAAADKKPVVTSAAPEVADKKPAVATLKPKAADKKPSATKPKPSDKAPAQVKALKDAIEKFNQE